MARTLFLFLVALAASTFVASKDVRVPKVAPSIPNGHWVDTWTAMPQLTEFNNLPNSPFNTTGAVFKNSTIRQTLHTSLGGSQIRIRISNAFGINDLPITAVTVALPVNNSAGSPEIITSTLQTLTFSGGSSFIIPNGAVAVSDPINFNIAPQSMLTVSMYLAQGQLSNTITSHPGSRTNSYMTFGNFVNSENITGPSTQFVAHWYFLSAVETWAPMTTTAFAIVGDSITDGRGSDTNGNNRWPDLVLAKMQQNPSTANIAVVNQAAGGNRILLDGNGPNALGRIERDVLAQSGVKYAMIFEGVNDIGVAAATTADQQVIGDRLITAFQQISSRVHTFGIPIFAATITPFSTPANESVAGSYSNPIREMTRQRVNNWIKTSGAFDAVVDFDALIRDPTTPSQLNPIYNSGDFLHPNVAGYQHLADNFPLDIFEQFVSGVNGFV